MRGRMGWSKTPCHSLSDILSRSVMMESVPLDVFMDSSTASYLSYNVPRIILRPQNGILMTGRSGSTTMNCVLRVPLAEHMEALGAAIR